MVEYGALNDKRKVDVFSEPVGFGSIAPAAPGERKRHGGGGTAPIRDERVSGAAADKCCEACGAGFASRNALFRHIKQCTAAAIAAAAEEDVAAPTGAVGDSRNISNCCF